MRTARAALFGVGIAAILTVAACAGDAQELDSRPVSERTRPAQGISATVLAPWWTSAEEASPRTRWTLDGNLVPADSKLFVTGRVAAVDGIWGEHKYGPRRPDEVRRIQQQRGRF